MEERKGTSATRAKNKYNGKAYDRLYPYVKKGRKAVYEETAQKAGLTLNEFVTEAIEEKVERTTGHTRSHINARVDAVLEDICTSLMEAIGDKAQLEKAARNAVKRISEIIN